MFSKCTCVDLKIGFVMVESEIDNANDFRTKYETQHVAQLICSQMSY